ncbi:MAG: HAMP domain-containing sensor histidine kinase [Actinomycetaceae bacterium]|nr:HAMP domain-containing sensor histidine kinase [Actinomycetaceae bacterium]
MISRPPPSRERGLAGAWQRSPLRVRLVALFTLVLSVGFALAGTAMLGILQAHLVDQVDRELQASAKTLALDAAVSLIKQAEPNIPSNYFIQFTNSESQITLRITDETVERYGRPIPGTLLPVGVYPPGDITRPVNIPSTLPGSYWRAVAVPISVDNAPLGVVVVALPLTGVAETLSNTARYFGLLGVVIIAVGATGSYYLIRRTLKPLSRIETVAGSIAAGDLSQRVEPQPTTTEVGSLADSLNRMLAQIEQSFADRDESQNRMRRFVSDASHELRTPLAAIRGYGELYRMGGVPEQNIPDVMARIESESTRMGTLVEDLLTLARLDERRSITPVDIDLAKMAEDAAFDLTALDPSRVIGIIGLENEDAPKSLVIEADSDQITQIFTNLIGNIVRYTPKGSPVEIALGTVADHAIVEFRDHGPGITDADREKVFARFYRTDISRSRASGGSGLGLAIVASITALHSGNATIDHTPGGGLTVRLSLPIHQPHRTQNTQDSDLRTDSP